MGLLSLRELRLFNSETFELSSHSGPFQLAEKLFEPVEHKFELSAGESLVKDERGVRLVIERDEDSD